MASPIISASDMDVLRADAESLMTDVFMAYDPAGTTTTDANDFEVDTPTPQGLTFGKIAGQSQRASDTYTRTISLGGVDVPVIEGGLSIPISAYVLGGSLAIVASERRGIGWEFVCTSVGPASDPSLLGSRWLVTNVPDKSYATARRLDVVKL